ncbi:MAG: radical SAM protein [Thermodesulfobacteriota bacterium]|nr:radical SAM protein [Thermodesulfobacteriota bacterium]
MQYIGEIYRPPSEAKSLILQLTVGCSHNRCTFCGVYKNKRFTIRPYEDIKADIDEVSRYGILPRVFLADADALITPMRKIVPVLEYMNKKIIGLERVGIYANAKGILKKSVEDLQELKALRLGIIYLGVETGDQLILDKVKKGTTVEKLIEASHRVKDAGIKLSVTVLLGLGGVEKSKEHALATAKILSRIDPDYAGALTVMVYEFSEIYKEVQEGTLKLPDPFQTLEELRTMISDSHFTHCFFTSNHASNYLPIRVWMPEEKVKTLEMIDNVINSRDENLLRPESLRAI